MKSLKELKAVAEKKSLRFEINKIPALNKIEIGIEYRSNIWAWWDAFTTDPENFDENEQLLTMMMTNKEYPRNKSGISFDISI